MNKELRERIIDHAIKLCLLADGDEMMYGDSYVEFGERSIKVINPHNITVSHNKNGVTAAIYGKSPIETTNLNDGCGKKCNWGFADQFVCNTNNKCFDCKYKIKNDALEKEGEQNE